MRWRRPCVRRFGRGNSATGTPVCSNAKLSAPLFFIGSNMDLSPGLTIDGAMFATAWCARYRPESVSYVSGGRDHVGQAPTRREKSHLDFRPAAGSGLYVRRSSKDLAPEPGVLGASAARRLPC